MERRKRGGYLPHEVGVDGTGEVPAQAPESMVNAMRSSASGQLQPIPDGLWGTGLEDLKRRGRALVPVIVSKCIQALDLYGLDVRWLYKKGFEGKTLKSPKTILKNGA